MQMNVKLPAECAPARPAVRMEPTGGRGRAVLSSHTNRDGRGRHHHCVGGRRVIREFTTRCTITCFEKNGLRERKGGKLLFKALFAERKWLLLFKTTGGHWKKNKLWQTYSWERQAGGWSEIEPFGGGRRRGGMKKRERKRMIMMRLGEGELSQCVLNWA